jgi:hypothetical protein
MAKHREDMAVVMADMIGARPDVEARTTFGVPGYLIRGKMFACVNHSGIGLKLPPGTIDALSDPEIGPFGRPGRPMRGWVQIKREDPEAFRRDMALIDLSIGYVAEQAAAEGPKPARATKKSPKS